MVKTSKLALPLAAAIFTFSLIAPAASIEANLCEREMARAAGKYGVPLGVLYAVGLTETGRGDSLRPYALNVEGRASYDHDKEEALRRFESARAAGAKLIDVGCMQINHHFHARHFASVSQMLEPAANVDYAARFLTQLKAREGNWTMGALSCRPQQRPGAEALRVPGDRQHDRDGVRRVDQAVAGVLPAMRGRP